MSVIGMNSPKIANTELPDFTKSITILVGGTPTSYIVPEDLLTAKSDFFRAACNGGWKENAERVVKLPEVKAEVFNWYLYWIFKGKVCLKTKSVFDGCDEFNDYDEEACDTLFTGLAELWILGDQMADTDLRNAVIDKLHKAIDRISEEFFEDTLFPPSVVNLIWSSTTPGRNIRSLVLDFHETCVSCWSIRDNFPRYNSEFIRELLVQLKQDNFKHNFGGSYSMAKCDYHEHDEKHPKCLKE